MVKRLVHVPILSIDVSLDIIGWIGIHERLCIFWVRIQKGATIHIRKLNSRQVVRFEGPEGRVVEPTSGCLRRVPTAKSGATEGTPVDDVIGSRLFN